MQTCKQCLLFSRLFPCFKVLKFFNSFVITVKFRHSPTIYFVRSWDKNHVCNCPISGVSQKSYKNFKSLYGFGGHCLKTFVWILNHVSRSRTWSLFTLKVAEHSFSARFCWCKLARAQGFQKTNMPSTERSFYLLKTCTIYVIFLYNSMQCIDGFSILLQRYVTKGNDAKNPAFLGFVCYRKNPVKCSACAVARKIETDCFSRNLPFSSDPVVRISRNLAQK